MADDALIIALDGEGTFDYFNMGFLSGGNVQAETCTCTDGLDNDEDGVDGPGPLNADEDDIDCQFEGGLYNPNGDEDIPQYPIS